MLGLEVYLVWKDYRHGSSEVYFKHSSDSGETWADDTRITNDHSPSYLPCITVENQNILITWEDWGDEAEIYMRLSQDNGKTFDEQQKITNKKGDSTNAWVNMANKEIHIVWQDDGSGSWEVYYKKSINDGKTWTPEQKLSNSKYESCSPKISIYQKNIIVYWQENQGNLSACKYKKINDNGNNWSDETLLLNNSENSYDSKIIQTQDKIHYVCKYETNDRANGIYYSNVANEIKIENTPTNKESPGYSFILTTFSIIIFIYIAHNKNRRKK